MKMPRAYPTWSRMWMIPNFFSHLERKEKATYLTVLWKGRLFVEFDSFCRSENACEIDEIFLFLETTIEILSFVSWVPECLNEQRFCISQKEKSQNIVEKDKKNLFELKNPIIITLLCSDGLSAARRAQLTFTTEKVPTFLLTDFHELFWSFSYYITYYKRFTAFAPR